MRTLRRMMELVVLGGFTAGLVWAEPPAAPETRPETPATKEKKELKREPGEGRGAKSRPRMTGWSREGMQEMLLDRLVSNPELAEELEFSDDQMENLKKVRFETHEQLISLNAEKDRLALKQAQLTTEAAPDEEAIMKIIEDLGGVQTQIAKLRVRQLLAARQIMTPEQIQKAKDLFRERLKQRREGGKERGVEGRPPEMGERGRGFEERRERWMERKGEGGKEPRAPAPPPPPPPENE